MPPFAIEMVYCSIASSKICWSALILSNSSIQQVPKSLKTSAPASKFYSPVPPSLTKVAVRPAFVVELPQT